MTQQSLEIPKQSISDMKNQRTTFRLPNAIGKFKEDLNCDPESSGVRRYAMICKLLRCI